MFYTVPQISIGITKRGIVFQVVQHLTTLKIVLLCPVLLIALIIIMLILMDKFVLLTVELAQSLPSKIKVFVSQIVLTHTMLILQPMSV